MTTVNAGATGTYTFTATQTVTVTLDPSETARVTITRAGVIVYGCVLTSTRTIGPFLAADVLSITAQRTAIDYTVNSYSLIPNVGAVGFGMGLSADTPTASASNVGYIYVKTDDTYGATPYMSNGVSFVQCGAGAGIGAGLSTTLWADRGTATSGLIKILTDFATQTGGNPNVLMIGDGTKWQPMGPQWLMRNPGAIAGAAPGTASDAATIPPLVTPAGFPNIGNDLVHELWYHGSATPIAATPSLLVGGTADMYTGMGTLRRGMLRRDILFPVDLAHEVIPQKASDTGYGFNLDNDGQTKTKDFGTQLTHTGSVTMTHASAITTTIDLSRWTWFA